MTNEEFITATNLINDLLWKRIHKALDDSDSISSFIANGVPFIEDPEIFEPYGKENVLEFAKRYRQEKGNRSFRRLTVETDEHEFDVILSNLTRKEIARRRKSPLFATYVEPGFMGAKERAVTEYFDEIVANFIWKNVYEDEFVRNLRINPIDVSEALSQANQVFDEIFATIEESEKLGFSLAQTVSAIRFFEIMVELRTDRDKIRKEKKELESKLKQGNMFGGMFDMINDTMMLGAPSAVVKEALANSGPIGEMILHAFEKFQSSRNFY